MTETGLDPDNLDNSTKVVRLKREDRILTASKNPKTGQPILHDTSVPSARNRPSVPVAQPTPVKERPFMKKGKHGRGGDFENDVDRQTGHGHQVSGVEELRLARYLDYRGDVYKKYPKYPAGEDISSEVKQGWRESELWYMGFKERYPGNGVMHLWPCGCEKMRGDSEDEESEEE
ncbi:hypothetical protein GQ44DRAFT_697817 [Phaeosphaeriaceae sp. PMI808]|nr:hypothetical protein GQ44DRAFT_697817 [Phaeosphaeriaceae sp. PMI808]